MVCRRNLVTPRLTAGKLRSSSGSLAMLAAMRLAWPPRLTPNRLTSSLDHLVGKLLELRWHIKAECRGGLEVDHEIEPLRALYR